MPRQAWVSVVMDVVPPAQAALMFCLFLFTIWSLRCAYRHYIRMPHSLAVAVLSQLMAVMATMSVAAAWSNYGR